MVVADLAGLAAALPVKVVDEGIDWPASITAGATVLLAILGLGAIWNLWDAKRTRHTQIVADLSRRWDEPLATKARDLDGEYDSSARLALVERVYNPPSWADDAERRADAATFFELMPALAIIETIGVLRLERAVDARVIFRLWGSTIHNTWVRWEEPIKAMRRYENRPGIFKPFELLAEEMGRRLAKET